VRTFPLRLSQVRGDALNNVDLAILKNTRVHGHRTLQFRLEALNAFNTPRFPNPNINPVAAQFGSIVTSAQVNYARRTQAMVRFIF
jgi:hypothetical protein